MVKMEEKKLNTKEMNHLKKILEDRKKQILKNISGVNDELDQLGSCELNDEGDHAATANHSMVDNIIIRKQQQELNDINNALSKVASGKYGTCEMCGVNIGFHRLEVKPHAIFCIDCRGIIEKEKK